MPEQLELFLLTNPHALYPIVFVLLIMAGTGFPVSADLVLLTCSYLAYTQKANLIILVPLCVFGIILSDVCMYFIAKRFGRQLLKKWPFKKIFTEHGIQKAESSFKRYGYKMVFAARFMPGVRTVFMFTSGLMRLKLWKFVLHDLAGGVIVIPCMLFSVTWVSGNKALILAYLQKTQWFALMVVLLLLSFVTIKKRKSKRLQKLDQITPSD